MSKKIHGQAEIRINGQYIESEDGATLTPGGLKNNPAMTGKSFYFNQTTIPSVVTCRVPVTKDTSIRALQELNDVEIIFQSDTGRTWIVRGACQTNELNLAGGEGNGKVELSFSGEPAEEMVQ